MLFQVIHVSYKPRVPNRARDDDYTTVIALVFFGNSKCKMFKNTKISTRIVIPSR